MIENQKNHYPNLNNKELTCNEHICRLVKPLLSDKSKSKEKITLTEGKKLITKDKGNTELLNLFFCNTVKNLKIPEFSDTNPQAENIFHPIFKYF